MYPDIGNADRGFDQRFFLSLYFSKWKLKDSPQKQKRTTLFSVVLVVDDTRLEFRGQSVYLCKSVSFYTDLIVSDNF